MQIKLPALVYQKGYDMFHGNVTIDLADDFGTNLARDKRYDQILLLARQPQNFTNAGGVLDFYASDHKPLFPDLTKEEFTYQMSDHLPLWIQINTDIDGIVLDQIIQRKQG
jgi:endonuclease/exonuclease/phosphatase family metal-dependent hydrolase